MGVWWCSRADVSVPRWSLCAVVVLCARLPLLVWTSSWEPTALCVPAHGLPVPPEASPPRAFPLPGLGWTSPVKGCSRRVVFRRKQHWRLR